MSKHDETNCARAGQTGSFTTPSSAPPIYQTTAFDLRNLDHLDAVARETEDGYIYTREGNPNHDAFASAIAGLEGAEAAFVTGSGMGALAAAILAHVKPGDHIIAARVLYGGTWQLLKHLASAFGIDVSFVDATRPGEFADAITDRTRIAIVETLSNPLLEVADLPEIVRAIGTVPLLVDSTFTSPCLIKPLDLGADFVFHSASKYLNGHGDVMLGVVAGHSQPIQAASKLVGIFGMNANPFECWLAARGLRTLPLRMQRVSETAARLAEFLKTHPAVARVHYPGLPSHPSHEIAKSLMSAGFGGMLSFELQAANVESVNGLIDRLTAIPFSPTLADARTTISHPASTSHRYLEPEERLAFGVVDGMIRLSVGLEAVDDLECELDAALRNQ